MRVLRNLLFPQSTRTYEIHRILRQQLLWVLTLRIVLYTLLMGITYLLSEFEFGIIILPRSAFILLLLSVYFLTIISALTITRRDINMQRFGFVQILLDTVFACLLIYFTGISNSIYSSLFFFPIIAGGLILPRKGGLIAAAASTILFGIILVLEYFQIVPDYFIIFDFSPLLNELELINLFAAKGLTFFLAALLSAMFGFRLTSTEEVLTDTIQSFDKLSHLYKTIFDNISTGIITANRDNIITSANTAAQSITGYNFGEIIGTKLGSLFPDLDLHGVNIRQAMDFMKKDGTETRIGYSITSLPTPPIETPATTKSRSRDEERILVTLQDISEIEKMERKLRQGEKMAAIGMMSAGIAHDFRNPLTAISGSAQVLANDFKRGRIEDRSENLALTDIILRESNRLITTISDFLELARPDRANRQYFSLVNCIEEVLQVCRANPEWPSTSKIEIDIDERLDIWADDKQFFTVMIHLIQNGMAFCPEGHEVIQIKAEELKMADDKEALVITVEDNGPGIEDELLEKIFEPFYTNRANGTGLGLAIVRQIIEGHRGAIEVSKSPLGGAKFDLILPYL